MAFEGLSEPRRRLYVFRAGSSPANRRRFQQHSTIHRERQTKRRLHGSLTLYTERLATNTGRVTYEKVSRRLTAQTLPRACQGK